MLEEATRARGVSRGPHPHDTGSQRAPAHGDPDDVRRIVRNLLENAVAHASTTVALVVTIAGDQARLDVSDDGPGIPPEHREQIFDRFHRVDASRPRGSGSGLGLAIARGLAERNGGVLDLVDSTRGAHLRLSLPMVTA